MKEFEGFLREDFDIFNIDGLDARMSQIRERLQPKFKYMGEDIKDYLSETMGMDMYLHIAKHMRRKVNPPKDTWLAIANNKRGYKQHPHFQFGLYDDHAFVWLAYLDEIPDKKFIADRLNQNKNLFDGLYDKGFLISMDHRKKDAYELDYKNLSEAINKLGEMKKGEFMIGKHILLDDELLCNGEALIEFTKDTFSQLVHIYLVQ